MSFDEYAAMSRRLYIVLKMEDFAAETGAEDRSHGRAPPELDLDPKDCLNTIGEDFLEDSKGMDHLTRDAFHDCIFQLTDLYAGHPTPIAPTPYSAPNPDPRSPPPQRTPPATTAAPASLPHTTPHHTAKPCRTPLPLLPPS